MTFSDKNYWAVILGGSSGFGLAAAKKLSDEGMNICVIHRDRKGRMREVQKDFDLISSKVDFLSFNCDALSPEVQIETLGKISKHLAEKSGKVRMLLHSIAFGNLKLLVPSIHDRSTSKTALQNISNRFKLEEKDLENSINVLFKDSYPELYTLAEAPAYSNEFFLEDEDIQQTIYAMGSSLLTWTKLILIEKLFTGDARVLGLTSEGNEIAWKGYAAVSAAKVVLESISRSIAVELAPYGLRSNIIQAGVTISPALKLIPGNEHISAKAKLRNPFGRLTMATDVANVIYLLCRDEASWINGDIIRVDGGEKIAG